jgi:lipid-A-disaccharide synthase
MLAAHVLAGLRASWSGLQTFGIGGPQMIQQGFEAWWPQERLAVRGYVEVLRHYPGLLTMRRQLASRLLHNPPDAFVGVDAPDFNLGLEATLRARGVKTIHFACPSIWAWRPERIHAIKRSVDHMLCVFPFEVPLLAQHGVQATYVGHPSADAIAVEPTDAVHARTQLGLSTRDPVVALLPGSRSSEIEAMGSLFVQAARLMHRARPALQFVMPAAPGRQARLQQIIQQAGANLPITLLHGQSHQALAACDVTLIASGTATLEAALFKRPMVIAYRMNAWSYRWMKGKALQPWIGLPNILAQETLVPERVQHDATPQALATDTLAWLDDGPRCDRLRDRFTGLHHDLKRDTARAATHAIAQTLHG